MKPCICPMCQKPALEVRTILRYRRGDRVLPVETRQWQCPSGCAGPGGEVPYVFADLATMKNNEARAKEQWKARFGEDMPLPRRAGRPTADPHTERLQVRLSKAELDGLDAVRGELSRSDFVRLAVVEAAGDATRPTSQNLLENIGRFIHQEREQHVLIGARAPRLPAVDDAGLTHILEAA